MYLNAPYTEAISNIKGIDKYLYTAQHLLIRTMHFTQWQNRSFKHKPTVVSLRLRLILAHNLYEV